MDIRYAPFPCSLSHALFFRLVALVLMLPLLLLFSVQLVSHAGSVDRIVMGLNRLTKAPCGFAFVVFRSPEEAKVAVQILSGAQCDGRVIRVDPDSGRDIDGDRKYGRGPRCSSKLFNSLLQQAQRQTQQHSQQQTAANTCRKHSSSQ